VVLPDGYLSSSYPWRRLFSNQAPQQKLWVRLGSGRRPRLCIKANFATFAVRNHTTFS